MLKVESFDSIKIKLASPEEILAWSHGEVTKPETINYRTQRPEKDGLFCEKIFGPTKDFECYCGKYRKVRYKGVICEKCGVEVTKSLVRRERMGHIKLAAPVVNIWFLRGVPSRIALLLNQPMQQIEKVVYFMAYIVTKVDEEARNRIISEVQKEFDSKKKHVKTKDKKERLKGDFKKTVEEVKSIKKKAVLSENDYRNYSLRYGECFKASTGAEAIKKLLEEINLNKSEKDLESDSKSSKDVKNTLQRLKLVRSLINSHVRPEWMCLTHLPVLPPDLRPMVQLDGGRYASSDLNDLYRRVINRNNRLRYLKEIGSPEVIVRNEKRMLQEAVDALIDNPARKAQIAQKPLGQRRQLKSLADMIRGKEGRFRQNLLGKRVDYSGRSVVVVGPELKLEEVGFPKKMALELFKPFIINKIIERGLARNVRSAGILISEEKKEIWEILEEVITEKYILLNRAPTLHRLSIQAFKPILIEGEAIQIHPLVCPAFNADFDGDQMAVFLPLSKEAQNEAKNLMLSSLGILKPANAQPIAIPRQEMVLGTYFMTLIQPGVKGEGRIFSSPTEAKLAYESDQIDIQAKIKVKIDPTTKNFGDITKDHFIETSVGRILFNEVLPKEFPYQNETQNSKNIQKLALELIEKYDKKVVASILDKIKDLGFEYSTLSANTWGMDDLIVPQEKGKILKETEKKEKDIKKQFERGFLSEEERKTEVIGAWQEARDNIAKIVPKTLPQFGPIFAIIQSGSRGSWSQPAQMAGMKGLVANPSGEIIELPVKNSYKEGLTPLEYFISTHGARKGTVDTALRTSKAGYLTRRLADVAHELIIKEKDCQDKKGIIIEKKDIEETEEDLSQKLLGRILLEDIKDKTGKALIKKGEMIDRDALKLIENLKIEKIRVRSPLSCKTLDGLCQTCYGSDLNTSKLVQFGTAVGIIAAQAIGEPGTQLTLRTFHTGGVAGIGDITQGLPRVEELLEARAPKGETPIFEDKGKIEKIEDKKDGVLITVKNEKKEKKEYKVPIKRGILVKKGETVFPGQPIFEGRIDIKKLLKFAGTEATQKYILQEVQKIYAGEGVAIHDKHIETIIRQMFSRLKITKSGDSTFSVEEVVSRLRAQEENERLKKAKKEEIKTKQILLGLTKVALSTDSFLSAASFEETSRVLIRAALEGREDKLRGLKENVIIGKLIPAGTGFKNPYEKKEQKEI